LLLVEKRRGPSKVKGNEHKSVVLLGVEAVRVRASRVDGERKSLASPPHIEWSSGSSSTAAPLLGCIQHRLLDERATRLAQTHQTDSATAHRQTNRSTTAGQASN
jgi:hypothetical protein